MRKYIIREESERRWNMSVNDIIWDNISSVVEYKVLSGVRESIDESLYT